MRGGISRYGVSLIFVRKEMLKETAYLCTIDDVHFALVDISYISGPQPAMLIDSRRSSSRIIKVAVHHTWAFDIHLTMHLIFIDLIAIDVLQPVKTNKARSHSQGECNVLHLHPRQNLPNTTRIIPLWPEQHNTPPCLCHTPHLCNLRLRR